MLSGPPDYRRVERSRCETDGVVDEMLMLSLLSHNYSTALGLTPIKETALKASKGRNLATALTSQSRFWVIQHKIYQEILSV